MAVNLFSFTTRVLSRNARMSIQKTATNTYHKGVIGNREIVGYGFNGMPIYVDRPDFPMPAIRWKEPTSDITVRNLYKLREFLVLVKKREDRILHFHISTIRNY